MKKLIYPKDRLYLVWEFGAYGIKTYGTYNTLKGAKDAAKYHKINIACFKLYKNL